MMYGKLVWMVAVVCNCTTARAQQHADTATAIVVPPANVSALWRNSVPKTIPQGQVVPADFSTRDFGFFCRQELKLDKKTVVPVRFRLGSQAICDGLEGK